MTQYSRDPSIVDYCYVDHFRVGNYSKGKWERLFIKDGRYRDLTLVHVINSSQDSVTGNRYGYRWKETIQGILVQKGTSLPSFAFGVSVLLDAALFSLDPVGLDVKDIRNKIHDPRDNLLYNITGILSFDNPGREGGEAYYLSQLQLDSTEDTGGL